MATIYHYIKVRYPFRLKQLKFFKQFVLGIIESILKIPAKGCAEFMAESYSYFNYSERNISGTETKSDKYGFLCKYYLFALLSFYV